jgi:arylsulfatase A-like enzyme
MQGNVLNQQNRGHDYIFAEYPGEYMIRTHNEKLLLAKDQDDSLYFLLQSDPYEMHNLYHDPSRKSDINKLKEVLLDWMLFTQPTHTHLDHNAAIVKGKNVPDKDAKNATKLKAYFREKMNS